MGGYSRGAADPRCELQEARDHPAKAKALVDSVGLLQQYLGTRRVRRPDWVEPQCMQIAAEGGQSIEVLKRTAQLSPPSLPLCVCFLKRVATVHFTYLPARSVYNAVAALVRLILSSRCLARLKRLNGLLHCKYGQLTSITTANPCAPTWLEHPHSRAASTFSLLPAAALAPPVHSPR